MMKRLLFLPLFALAVSACATPSNQPIIQVRQAEGRSLKMPKQETKAKNCKKMPTLGGVEIQCEKFMLAANDVAVPGELSEASRAANIRIAKEGMAEDGFTLKREGDHVTFQVNERAERYERFVFEKEGTLFTLFWGFAFVGKQSRMMTCMFQDSVPEAKAQQMCPRWLTQVSLYAHELKPGAIAIKNDLIEIPKTCKLGDHYIKCKETTQVLNIIWQEFTSEKTLKRAMRVAKDNISQFKQSEGWSDTMERETECDFAGSEMKCSILKRVHKDGQTADLFIMNGYIDGRYIYVGCMASRVNNERTLPALCSKFFTLDELTKAI